MRNSNANYNLKNIMNKAWNLFRANFGTFSDCLKQAWEEAKELVSAVKIIGAEVRTWFGWKQMGFEVMHGSKAVFQRTIADTTTKSGYRVVSYFTRSQVAPIAE